MKNLMDDTIHKFSDPVEAFDVSEAWPRSTVAAYDGFYLVVRESVLGLCVLRVSGFMVGGRVEA